MDVFQTKRIGDKNNNTKVCNVPNEAKMAGCSLRLKVARLILSGWVERGGQKL